MKNQAFYQAYNLEKIVIGDQLVSFSYEAFVNPQNAYGHSINTCDRMREFVVSENNKNFASPDGVLYDKAMTTLLSYPNMKAKNTPCLKASRPLEARLSAVATTSTKSHCRNLWRRLRAARLKAASIC